MVWCPGFVLSGLFICFHWEVSSLSGNSWYLVMWGVCLYSAYETLSPLPEAWPSSLPQLPTSSPSLGLWGGRARVGFSRQLPHASTRWSYESGFGGQGREEGPWTVPTEEVEEMLFSFLVSGSKEQFHMIQWSVRPQRPLEDKCFERDQGETRPQANAPDSESLQCVAVTERWSFSRQFHETGHRVCFFSNPHTRLGALSQKKRRQVSCCGGFLTLSLWDKGGIRAKGHDQSVRMYVRGMEQEMG